jgi:hypothetical protein
MVLEMLLERNFCGSRAACTETLKGHDNEEEKSSEQAALARRFDFGSKLIFEHSRRDGRDCG